MVNTTEMRDLTQAELDAIDSGGIQNSEVLPTGLTPDVGPVEVEVFWCAGKTFVVPHGEAMNGEPWAYDAYLPGTEVVCGVLKAAAGL